MIVSLARAVLVAVFAYAGGAKLLDQPGTRRAIVDFGVPPRWAPSLAWALPITELVTAGLLCGSTTARAGAALALALLVIFCIAAGATLARGRRPACACFGATRSTPVGPRLLLRNGALATIAVVVIAGAPAATGSSGPWPELTGIDIVLGLCTTVLALAVIGLTRRLGSLEERLAQLAPSTDPVVTGLDAPPAEPPPAAEPPAFHPGLPVGSPAPDLALPTGDGSRSLASLWSTGRPAVVLFVSPTCSTCHDLLPKPARWADTYGDVLAFALVTAGDAQANEGIDQVSAGFQPVLFDPGPARAAYEVAATPAGVVVDPLGTVVSETVYGVAEITMLVMRTAAAERGRVQADHALR